MGPNQKIASIHKLFPHCNSSPGTLSNPFLLCIPWEALVLNRLSSSALVQKFLDTRSYLPAHPNSTDMTTCDADDDSKFSRFANGCSGVQTSLGPTSQSRCRWWGTKGRNLKRLLCSLLRTRPAHLSLVHGQVLIQKLLALHMSNCGFMCKEVENIFALSN